MCRDPRTHLAVLARLGRLLQLPDFLEELRGANDSASSYAIISRADEGLGSG
jgi:PTS system nitrogen regulatory IIA component